jgi:hypothetical protein
MLENSMDPFVENVVAGASRHKEQVVTELGIDYVRKWRLRE